MAKGIPEKPTLDLRARLFADHFYEIAAHRTWTYVLTPTEKGFVSTPKPDPLRISEVVAWLDEAELSGEERESVLGAVRQLDRAWRDEWHDKNRWETM